MPPTKPFPVVPAWVRFLKAFLISALGLIMLLIGLALIYAPPGRPGEDLFVRQIVGGIFTLTGAIVGIVAIREWLLGKDKNPAFREAVREDVAFEVHPAFPKPAQRARGNHGWRIPQDTPPLKTALGCGTLSGLLFLPLVAMETLSSGSWGRNALDYIAAGIFALIGLPCLVWVGQYVLKAILVGNTVLEIDREPGAVGGAFQIWLLQAGSFPISELVVELVCEEVASYRQGTDTVKVRHEAHCEVLAKLQNLQANYHVPVATIQGTIPPGAMHSFAGVNNQIRWFFRVQMDIPGRPDVKDEYEFSVAPTVDERGSAR